MHLLSFPISLELKGRTLTATFTEAPAMLQVGVGVSEGAGDLCGYTDTRRLAPAQVDDQKELIQDTADRCRLQAFVLHCMWSSLSYHILNKVKYQQKKKSIKLSDCFGYERLVAKYLRQGFDGLRQLTHSPFLGPKITVSLPSGRNSQILNHAE